MSRRHQHSFLLLVFFTLVVSSQLLAQVAVHGTITEGGSRPVGFARVRLDPPPPAIAIALASNDEGVFSLELEQAGHYFLTVTAPGFHALSRQPVEFILGANLVTIELTAVELLSASVDVSPDNSLSVEHMAASHTLTESEILSIPVSRSNSLNNIVAVMPGAIKDSDGKLHFQGSSAEQTTWALDGFGLTDPISGRPEVDLSVEAVKSLDLFSGSYSAEFGKGSGGTLLLTAATGDNSFEQRLTNFIPGLEQNKGLTLSSWRPKWSLSGPIKKDRVWFSNGLDFNVKQNIIAELPKGRDRSWNWSASNLLRFQVNWPPAHLLTANLVLNYLNAPRTGLSPLDPEETTLDLQARRFFVNVKDQMVFPGPTILEFGYGAYRSHSRQGAQGEGFYQVTPSGRGGNFPSQGQRVGQRDQWLARMFLPAFDGAGHHQFAFGLDVSWSRYFQDLQRSGYEFYRLDGSQAYRIEFRGKDKFGNSNVETAVFLQDRWAPRSWLLMGAGLRWERDRFLSSQAVTPRLSLTLFPPRLKHTRFSAGFGVVPEATPLSLLTQDLDQYSIATRYAHDGKTIVEGPCVRSFRYTPRSMRIPLTTNLSLGFEQGLPGKLSLQASFLRKRSAQGPTFVPAPHVSVQSSPSGLSASSCEAVYDLLNSRRESYDSFELGLRRQFRDKAETSLSYTRSRAYSNAAFENHLDQPIVFSNPAGRLAWDTPHRLVSWGIFPLTRNNTLAYFLEWRDGFPFSIHSQEGKAIGEPNSWELPRYFTLNIHFERKVCLLSQQWAVRLGADNVTNHANFALVNPAVESPDFLHFYGRQPPKLVVRIRWLGRMPK
ncbi:MAG: hypothetical protein L0387_44310 [Acidobacteria bacterium]|nr:hypothetical protein [Acidobacteriota bacterium]MCI0628605.1 hypothetical protein [Acidobacteriota bacterium]MCI0721360.1 hypothetical protein [Acidobacteriota bacterium]